MSLLLFLKDVTCAEKPLKSIAELEMMHAVFQCKTVVMATFVITITMIWAIARPVLVLCAKLRQRIAGHAVLTRKKKKKRASVSAAMNIQVTATYVMTLTTQFVQRMTSVAVKPAMK